ncbi:MAG TPA: twin-arginine translocase TatA/TatE family subunit [Edaphocola sp.]|nr:twin-arginine translocase TatA/TatE family subunit [Edaphocola sp.]
MTIMSFQPSFLISMPSGMEWLWIVLVVVILFGGKKIPELAKGIGKGIREFNDAKEGVKRDIESGINEKNEVKEDK